VWGCSNSKLWSSNHHQHYTSITSRLPLSVSATISFSGHMHIEQKISKFSTYVHVLKFWDIILCICAIALSSDLWMCVCLDFIELNCTSQTRGHPHKLYKPRTYNTVQALYFSICIINVWNVSLLIVWISPRLLPLNALLNRLILLRFYCATMFN